MITTQHIISTAGSIKLNLDNSIVEAGDLECDSMELNNLCNMLILIQPETIDYFLDSLHSLYHDDDA